MAKFSASFTFIDRKGIELSVLTSCPKPSAKTKKQQFLGTAQMKGAGPRFFYHSILFALIMHQDLQTICHSVNQHNPESRIFRYGLLVCRQDTVFCSLLKIQVIVEFLNICVSFVPHGPIY